jgi:hypothetical protein
MVFGMFKREKKETGKYKKPYYSIMSVHSGKVVDICQDGDNENQAIIWETHGNANQQFTIVPHGDKYMIKCKKNHGYLTVESDQNGAKIYTASKQSGNKVNQLFTIDEGDKHKQHCIYTFCGKVLDVKEASKDNGTTIVQWDHSGDKNQLWSFCDPQNITSSSSEI